MSLSSVQTKIDLSRYYQVLATTSLIKLHGKVTQIIGLIIEAEGPGGNVGDLCYIYSKEHPHPIRAEVVGFRNNKVLLMPLGEMTGIGPGCEVRTSGRPLAVKVGPGLLGRVLDGLGNPMDGKGPLETVDEYPLQNKPPNPITRPRITEALPTGVRVIDATLTLGKGQRIGIFAGSGVGKSTTLSMIARNTTADINVIGLVGERGRELRDFIERDLGDAGLRRSVVVCATSDQAALIRIKGAYVATAIAEYFRDQGKDVILMMDSVTRFAMAQREVGLAIGEPPATKGYTPSVFAILPKLLERSGTSDKGSVTGIYTVLVEGDDMNEPIADHVRSILDGHIVLSRAIAHQNQYPSVDVLQSISRLFPEISTEEHQQGAAKIRKILDTYRKKEDLINIGAYVDGSDPDVDHAKRMIRDVRAYLAQGIYEPAPFEESLEKMNRLLSS